MKTKILLLGFALAAMTATAQTFNFANRIGGTGYEQGYGIATDNNGNSIVSGAFSSTVDFDPSASTLNLTSNGLADGYIAKYNATGGLIWAKSFGGANDDFSGNVAIANNGDVYATGFFNGTVDFNPGASVFNLTSAGEDIFVVKLDGNGNFIWAIKMGGATTDGGISIALDNIGNCYVSGTFTGTADFDPSANVQNLVSAGGTDDFFAKYDSNGNYVWAKRIGNTTYDERAYSLTVDSNQNIYLTGYFQGTLDLDPNAGVYNLTSAGSEDIYFAKYTNNGNLIWAKKFGGTSLERPIQIKTDNKGYCYLTGIFDGTCDFDPSASVNSITSKGAHDGFIAKYDSTGNYSWAVGYGSTGNDQAYGLSIDGTGNVYGIGNFQGTVNFDPKGVSNLTSNGGTDICFTKYSSSGQLLWAKSIGGTGEDLGWNMAFQNGYLYYTGHFKNTVDFNPDLPVSNLTSMGDFDAFLLKMSSGECMSIYYDTVKTTVHDTVKVAVMDTLIINAKLTGVNPPNNVNAIKVFPNPTKDNISINTGTYSLMNGYSIKVTNTLGQTVFQSLINQQQFSVDLSSWSGMGTYIISIIDKQSNVVDTRKIILQ